jgi:acetoin utilization deacetylase AcuC-like enzyme
MKTAFLTHPLFLEHDTGTGHPERAARLRAIETHLRQTKRWDELIHLDFAPASVADLETCHTPQHIARVKKIAENGGGALDGDTIISAHSFEAALSGCGAAMRAVDAVCGGEVDSAFVAARPCGHHAESGADFDSPWGFCLFNQVAVAARHAQKRWNVARVAVLDFDVHHGNGTQEIFYEDPSVFFASLHESPLFPGSGASTETGAGAGVGFTLNLPLRAGSKGAVYQAAWAQVGGALGKFEPQLILLSAGYDAHRADPLAHMELEIEDYRHIITEAKRWAHRYCDGKFVAILEGGYDLDALSQSVAVTLDVMRSDT